MSNGWDDDRIATLIEMWRSGATAAKIGERIGVSRNAVIGKMHRLKKAGAIHDDQRVTAAAEPRTSIREPKITPIENGGAREIEKPSEPQPTSGVVLAEKEKTAMANEGDNQLAPIEDVPEPPPTKRGIHLTKLRPRSCRWPLWGGIERPTFRYCGDETPDIEHSYCQHHAEISSRPVVARAPRRPFLVPNVKVSNATKR